MYKYPHAPAFAAYSLHIKMAKFEELVRSGNGLFNPKLGDEVIVEYTGWLYDDTQPRNRGKEVSIV
jgi:hypothetical protein